MIIVELWKECLQFGQIYGADLGTMEKLLGQICRK
jgi:hypothetical protein